MKLIFEIALFLVLILGVFYLIPSTAKKLIKFRNDLGGAKTNITNASLVSARMQGMIAVIGAVILLYILFSNSLLQ